MNEKDKAESLVSPEVRPVIFGMIDKRLIDILHLSKFLTDNKVYLSSSYKNSILDKLYIAHELLSRLVNVYDG